jgi:hypothetical protein
LIILAAHGILAESFEEDSPMPRKSPFRIVLTAAEAAELNRRAAKYTLPYFEVVRAKMILMAAAGNDNDEIGLY